MRTALTLVFVLMCAACAEPVVVSSSPSAVPSAASPSAANPTPSATPSPLRSGIPLVADRPAAIAEQLTVAERAIRDVAVTGIELAWQSQVQQLVYRRLVERADLRDAVFALLPVDLREVAVAHIDAGADLRALVTPRDELPPWRIVEPAPVEELLGYYHGAEAEFGVPWHYLAAIHLVETRMGRIRGTSTAGAQGPMQFIPSTWAAYGEGDINSNRDAIRAAARYLRANRAPADMANALFRYNNSQRYVRAVTAYAEIMRAEPTTYRGYHQWQVYYITTRGDVLLQVGYVRG